MKVLDMCLSVFGLIRIKRVKEINKAISLAYDDFILQAMMQDFGMVIEKNIIAQNKEWLSETFDDCNSVFGSNFNVEITRQTERGR